MTTNTEYTNLDRMNDTLTATTPCGTFTRKTHNAYTHVLVWRCPSFADGDGVGNVARRIRKQGGFDLTWHKSTEAARKAIESGHGYDPQAVLMGIFSVDTGV